MDRMTVEQARELTVHRDIGMLRRPCDWRDCRLFAHYALRLRSAPRGTEFELRSCPVHMDDVRLHLADNREQEAQS